MVIRDFRKNLRERFITLIIAAFSLVAALAWNEAITNLFKYYFGEQANLIAKFIYAFVVTILVVIVVLSLDRFFNKE